MTARGGVGVGVGVLLTIAGVGLSAGELAGGGLLTVLAGGLAGGLLAGVSAAGFIITASTRSLTPAVLSCTMPSVERSNCVLDCLILVMMRSSPTLACTSRITS